MEPAESRLFHWLADVFGYRLRVCGRCRGYRLFRAHGSRRSHSLHDSQEQPMEGMPEAPAVSPGSVAVAEAEPDSEKASDGDGFGQRVEGDGQVCPSCGSHDCRRSHRTWWERRRKVPPMYRCRQCDYRFPEL